MDGKNAWVTLATNDNYCLGALVLAHSLRKVSTNKTMVVLITPNVSEAMRMSLASAFHQVKEVNILDSKDEANLKLLARPELGITFTKLNCWKLTQFEKCVFLDADTLVLKNCDELFQRDEFSAAPDVGWPDCFNSGVFVFKPSNETYESLINFAITGGSFDGGDQGLLNMYFSNWVLSDATKRLSFLYNLCSTAVYSYLPAFKWFGKDAKIVHFIGAAKPWLQSFNPDTRTVESSGNPHLTGFLQCWWDLFCTFVHPTLSSQMMDLAGAFSSMVLGDVTSPEWLVRQDFQRRQNWEEGNMDYMGKDSFDNIWKKISDTMSKVEETAGKMESKIRALSLGGSEVPGTEETAAVESITTAPNLESSLPVATPASILRKASSFPAAAPSDAAALTDPRAPSAPPALVSAMEMDEAVCPLKTAVVDESPLCSLIKSEPRVETAEITAAVISSLPEMVTAMEQPEVPKPANEEKKIREF